MANSELAHCLHKQAKRPICPKCNANIQWSWEQDCYVADSTTYATETMANVPSDVAIEINIQKCPNCGKILGIGVMDDDGSTLYNHPEFGMVDWQDHPWLSSRNQFSDEIPRACK